FPAEGFAENHAWLQVVMIANDLITWTKLIAYKDHPSIGRAEIAAFRYMILHTAARITRGARQIRLRVDVGWRWANEVAHGYTAIRDAFT
ncbi:IS1380 family transposase, partial [Nesterenkonia alkaliphila]